MYGGFSYGSASYGGGVAFLVIIEKSVSDSGSGVDAIAVKQFKNIADSGAGVETIAIKGTIPVADSGSGVDTIQKVNQLLVQDSGTGIEALEVKLVKAVQDSGIGTDLISAIKAQLSISGLGSGVDTIGILSKVFRIKKKRFWAFAERNI